MAKLGELERLGPDGMDYLVLGVEARGFEDLTSSQRALAYYLYRAAVNTSVNLHGYPLVHSPEDAIDVLCRSGLQYLALGDHLVRKTGERR